MFPGIHAVQDSFLLLRRQTVETFEPLPQLLLPLWRQLAKLRIAVQCALLLVAGNVSILA
jgi:hypothetical protein